MKHSGNTQYGFKVKKQGCNGHEENRRSEAGYRSDDLSDHGEDDKEGVVVHFK